MPRASEVMRLRKQNEQLLQQRADLGAALTAARAAAPGPVPVESHSERDLDHVFVLTFGRSGSTLLQGVLNSFEGVLVRGENMMAVAGLRDFVTRVRRARDGKIGTGIATHPWFGIEEASDELLRVVLRGAVEATLIRPHDDTRIAGFKEIRWHHDGMADQVDFVRWLFPGARFVINLRRVEDAARSRWWSQKDDGLEVLRGLEAQLLAEAERLGEDAFVIRYEDYLAQRSEVHRLAAWLGVEADDAVLDQVLERKHAY